MDIHRRKSNMSIIIGIKTATFSQLSMFVHIRFRTFWYLKLCTSPKWKARVRFFEGWGGVCHRCRRRFLSLSWKFRSRESLSQFQSNLCSKKDCTLLQGGENKEKMKIHWRIPNFFSFKTTRLISNKLIIKHFWVKIFNSSLFKWQHTHFTRGNYREILKIIFFI